MIAYIVGVLVIALGVGLSIGLHEIGHLVPAKKFGVKVTQYMVGFGPTIWSRQRGETEYGIKAIPLGGYIRMIGMFPPKPGDDPNLLRASSTGRFSQLMDQARQDSMDEVRPGDEHRVFYKLSVPKKVVVMLGGPTMNLVIAFVLFGGLLTLYGVPTATPLISSVAACVPTTAPTTATRSPPAPPVTRRPRPPAGLQAGRPHRLGQRHAGHAVGPGHAADPPAAGSTLNLGSTGARSRSPCRHRRRPEPGGLRRHDKVKVDANGNVVTERVGYLGATPHRRAGQGDGRPGAGVRLGRLHPDRERRRQRPAEDGGRRPGGLRLRRARPQRPDLGRRRRPGGRRDRQRRPRRRRHRWPRS